jgi:hypothetical protein
MSWGAQSRSEDAKTPGVAGVRSDKPEPVSCPVQPYVRACVCVCVGVRRFGLRCKTKLLGYRMCVCVCVCVCGGGGGGVGGGGRELASYAGTQARPSVVPKQATEAMPSSQSAEEMRRPPSGRAQGGAKTAP